ncbi:MAG: hypothetical protein HQM08_28220 [Candidatus Riflebacteria bacterium]|nr:hypothetical protein [Candidatus Riflebacteria bacterium]
MKLRLSFLMVVLALVIVAIPAFAINEWDILIYMSSDSKEANLEEANIEKMKSISEVGVPAGVELLVLEDRGPNATGMMKDFYPDPEYRGGDIYSITKNSVKSEAKLGEVNMGSPYTLWNFLKHAVEKHPAKRYFLIFDSHGSGVFSWRGTGSTSSSKPGSVDFDPSKFVAYDDTDNDCLTVFEIESVLNAFKDRLNSGRKIDLVGVDACLPVGAEALFQFRNVIDVFIGSADTTPLGGFEYPGFLDKLGKQPQLENEKVACMAIDSLGNRSLGAWRLSKAQELTFAINNLAMELIRAVQEKNQKFTPKDLTSYGGKDYYWDLIKIGQTFKDGNVKWGGFFSKAPSNLAVIQQMGGELLDAIKACKVSSNGSISIAWPKVDDYKNFRAFYKAFELAKQTKWDEFLDLILLQ